MRPRIKGERLPSHPTLRVTHSLHGSCTLGWIPWGLYPDNVTLVSSSFSPPSVSVPEWPVFQWLRLPPLPLLPHHLRELHQGGESVVLMLPTLVVHLILRGVLLLLTRALDAEGDYPSSSGSVSYHL